MLARCEKLYLPNGDSIDTPLLLPSFSSKGFPELKKIIKILEENITGPVLISAYDIYYKLIQRRITFSSQLLFIDSGGYECSSAVDFVDHGKGIYKPKRWNERIFFKTAKLLLSDNIPKVIISYDHPKSRQPIDLQIESAIVLFKKLDTTKKFVKEILLKPETSAKDKQYLAIDRVVNNVQKFKSFDIIGVTEKELGDSLLERMLSISKIRAALNKKGMKQLVHVFGSLDTMSTPLYFMSGADIFDGLTWLRYSYYNGMTLYQPNYWIVEYSFDYKDYLSKLHSFSDNYVYLKKLFLEMRNYQKTGDFNSFSINGDLFKRIWATLQMKIKGE